MIYEYPDIGAPIRQGDIFLKLPKVEMEFASGLPTLPRSDAMEKIPWEDIVKTGGPTPALLSVNPVPAIVASQDCDARQSPDITLCEIKEFINIERNFETPKIKNRVNLITRHSRINQKWFYLPPDERIGFDRVMGVDFRSTINVPREELETLKNLRKGRLIEVAYDHFRERIAQFYRRYAYNEWYPLNKEEMTVYASDHGLSPSDWYEHQK